MARTQGAAGEESGTDPTAESSSGRFLGLVRTLNERCLDLMSQMPAADALCSCRLSSVTKHRDVWRRLDAITRQRLARLPFVIVDIHFMDRGWWQHARLPIVRDSPRPTDSNCLREAIGAALTQETLMLTWHAVQVDRRAAIWRIGMSQDVAETIWQLSAQDMLRIAATFPCEACPRWCECAELWRRMIGAAQSGDEIALGDARREAMLRLNGELLIARPWGGES